MLLKDKVAVITGAASARGLGFATAKLYAEQGAKVVIIDLDAEASKQAAASLGEGHLGLAANVSNELQVNAAIEQVLGKYGRIDILVNNAGITNDKLLLRMTKEDFNACLDINLVGTFNMTQQAVKRMMKQRSGRIINMASVPGLMGNVGQANYAASKAGVVGFTKSVAREVAPRGITCNAIAPGFIQTEMTDVLSEKVKTQMNAQIPLQTFGQVEDVAATAIFLAKSPYITGQVVNVDGGLVMHG